VLHRRKRGVQRSHAGTTRKDASARGKERKGKRARGEEEAFSSLPSFYAITGILQPRAGKAKGDALKWTRYKKRPHMVGKRRGKSNRQEARKVDVGIVEGLWSLGPWEAHRAAKPHGRQGRKKSTAEEHFVGPDSEKGEVK